MKTIDLHVHSNKSDGTYTPTGIIEAAIQANLSAVALTDHDTADGILEAYEATKTLGKDIDFEFIPGIELSISYHCRELHLVGLFLNPFCEAFEQALKLLRNNRDARNYKMIERMQNAGVDITMEKLRQQQGDCVLTRANFAHYLLHIGFVSSIQEAFDKYLSPEKPFYVQREYMNPKDAIDLIHSVNGVAILAHPLLYHFDDLELENAVAYLKELGLDGIETWYSMNTGYDLQRMKKLADKYQLVYSGGSDFHGDNKPHIALGRGKGNLFVPADILDTIKTLRK